MDFLIPDYQRGYRWKERHVIDLLEDIDNKYYSSFSATPNYWTREDAEAYKENIYETLKDFGVQR